MADEDFRRDVARSSAYQLLPMVILTRSESGDLVRLPDVSLPRWMHDHLRQYDRLSCSLHPQPETAFYFADEHPRPHDTVNTWQVELKRYCRYELGRVVLEAAVIFDPEQAERFIRYHQRMDGA